MDVLPALLVRLFFEEPGFVCCVPSRLLVGKTPKRVMVAANLPIFKMPRIEGSRPTTIRRNHHAQSRFVSGSPAVALLTSAVLAAAAGGDGRPTQAATGTSTGGTAAPVAGRLPILPQSRPAL
jgi:hypothetical protein